MAALRAAYQPGRGMAMAFGAFLEQVLGPHGLVVYDSSDPATKPLAHDVFVREVSEPGNTARIAGRAGEALVAKGYHAQATLADGTVSVFHLNAQRAPIRVDGNKAYVGETTMSLAQLVEEAKAHPEHFSPNVLLRPLVQDTVFPTICYVAGPNELAYLGQLKEIYAHFGVPMPLMYQRGYRDAGRLGHPSIPHQVRLAADRASRAGRIRPESAARKPVAADRGTGPDRRVVADR